MRAKILEKNKSFPQAGLEYGEILEEEQGSYLLLTNYGETRAFQAVSCLVRPAPGDQVLFSLASTGPGHILAVVSRAEENQGTDLRLSGPVNLQVLGGNLTISAEKDLVLGAGEEISMASTRLSCWAEEAEGSFLKLSLIGKFFKSQLERISVAAETVEHVFAHFTQRPQNAFRFVKDHEEVQTGSTRVLVEETISIHSKNALHMAEEIVTINAGQIHLG
ncbi:MAG: DUF3540 domain-containing protein [Deltaproteobacteria bacterium]|nr:DUF3540 domain-containing protein [Deltaproteobacteria bacterium]